MNEKEMRMFAKIWFEEETLYRAKTQLTREETLKERDLERQEYFKKIMKLAKAVLPMPYQVFVYQVAYYLNLSYLQNDKRGVYMRELDILVGIGKLCKSQDGKLTLHNE